MTQHNSEQHAIVLTGSGTNAAYEVGVLRALLQPGVIDSHGRAPITPYCVSGTSMGAFNAATLVSADLDVDELEKIWLDRIAVDTASSANGIFRIRAEPTQYISQVTTSLEGSVNSVAELMRDMLYFMRETSSRLYVAMTETGTLADRAAKMTELNQWIDIEPLVALLASTVRPDVIRRSATKLAITALDWRTGQPHTFSNRELGVPRGAAAVFAAMAMPGVVPPPKVDGRHFVDAGVLMDRPLKPALDRRDPTGGPVVLHVIYVDALTAELPSPAVSNTFTTVYRLLMLALSRLVAIDLKHVEDINRQLFTKRALETAVSIVRGTTASRSEDAIADALGIEASVAWEDLTKHTKNKVPVTVHRYRPTKHIHGFDLAGFERDSILTLIEDGREDALNHDCEMNGCIKVDSPARS